MLLRYTLIAAAFFLFIASVFCGTAKAASSPDVIKAVNAVAAQSERFRSMMSNLTATQFHFVGAETVLGASDQAAYKSALRKNAKEIADLRDTLNHTTLTGTDGVITTLTRFLSSKNLTVRQIVGILVGEGGQITVFYQ